jgi:hypothetical protein
VAKHATGDPVFFLVRLGPRPTIFGVCLFIFFAPFHSLRVHGFLHADSWRGGSSEISRQKAMLFVAHSSAPAYQSPLSKMNTPTHPQNTTSHSASSTASQLPRSSGIASLAPIAAATSSPASSSSFVHRKERDVRRAPSFERTQTAPPGSRLLHPDGGFVVTSRPPPTTLFQPISAQSSLIHRKRDKDSVKGDEPEEVTETRKVFWGHDAEGRRMVNQLSPT